MSDIRERPLILTAQEVNAVLAGNKTQHRMIVDIEHSVALTYHSLEAGGAVPERLDALPYDCPFGAEGDRLWVQEPTLAIEDVGWIGPVFVASDAGRNAIDWGYGPYDDPAHIPACELTYNKPDDLSYEDSRLLLEITDIRIERVQDITHNDSVREAAFTFYPKQAVPPLSAFPRYWMEKHGDDAWRLNPWVWVVEFKVIKESDCER